MKMAEAKAECERWFAYLDRQRDKSLALQKIASRVRSGEITSDEGRREIRNIDGRAPVVYDGARLEQAVKLLLKNLKS